MVAVRGILGNKQWYVSSSINRIAVRLVCVGGIQSCLLEMRVYLTHTVYVGIYSRAGSVKVS